MKGISFRSVAQALEVLRGTQCVASCMAALPRDVADAFRYGTILASSWYSIEWYRALLRSVAQSANGGDRFIVDIGRQCMRQDMNGVYRAVFRLLTPQVVLRLTTRLYSNYYDTGSCSVVEARTGFARASWSGCTGFDRNMWNEVFGATAMLMELAGAKHIRSHVVAGGRDGDDAAELVGHWM